MPTAFVTGATGQDGSFLIELLNAKGWDVHALVRDRTEPGETDVPEWVVPHTGDLADSDSLTRIVLSVAPDLIVNLGGVTSVALSWEKPELTSRITGLSVAALLEAAWRVQEAEGKPVRFVQASSSEIFGNAAEVPQNERTPIDPVSPYGAAKAFAHQLVRVYRRRGLFASNAVLYNHESPRRPTTFVTRKITAGVAAIARGRERSIVLGNLDARRDWGWAPDYVAALVAIAEAPEADDFVVATGVEHSVRDFVAAAFRAAGIDEWESLVEADPRLMRPSDASVMCGDASKIRSTLGWSPTVGFDELVARMVEHDLALLPE